MKNSGGEVLAEMLEALMHDNHSLSVSFQAWTDHHVYAYIFSMIHWLNNVEVNCMLWLHLIIEFTLHHLICNI